MLWRWLVLAVVCGGCGRLGYETGELAALGNAAGPNAEADAGGNGQLRWQSHAVGLSGPDETTLATDTVDAVAGDLYLAAVSVKNGVRAVSVEGMNLTWELIHSQCGGRSTGTLAVFWARGRPTSGPVIASIGDDPESQLISAVVSVHRYSGANASFPIGAVAWSNTNGTGVNAACTGGEDSNEYTWSGISTTAPGSAVVVFTHTANYAHTPGAGFAERSDDFTEVAPMGDTGIAVQDRIVANPGGIVVSGSFEGFPDWVSIAIELLD